MSILPTSEYIPKPKRSFSLSPVTSADDYTHLAKIQIMAFDNPPDAVALLIRPLDRRPPLTERIETYAKRIEGEVQKGQDFIIKATLNATGEVVGFAKWVRPGVSVVQPKSDVDEKSEREKIEESEKEGIDYNFLQQFAVEKSSKRDNYMQGKDHWQVPLFLLWFSNVEPGSGTGI